MKGTNTRSRQRFTVKPDGSGSFTSALASAVGGFIHSDASYSVMAHIRVLFPLCDDEVFIVLYVKDKNFL